MPFSKVWLAPTGIVALLLLWLVVGRGESAESAYRFVEVERGDVVQVVSSTGTLQATQTVEVGTQVSGQVAQIFVDFNDRVQAGQLIARIDPTLPMQEVRSAEAAIQRVEAELAQTRRDMERAQGLHEQQVVTDAELEQAQYAYAVARASHTSAQVSLERARRNLGYTEIRAPVNGVVIERSVDVGQTVAASMSAPVLFVIAEDLTRMEILAAVDESDIGRIYEGQEVTFGVQAWPDEEFHGVVSQVRLQSAMTENVVSYMVVVRVDNQANRLIPGMTATVDFVIAHAEDALTLANSAIRFRPTAAMQAEIAPPGAEPAESATAGGGQRQRRGEGARDGSGPRGPRGPRPAAGAADSAGGPRVPAFGTATVWLLDEAGRLDTMEVRTGLTDGQVTVVFGDQLEEGMEVIAAVTSDEEGTAGSPFRSGQQQPAQGGPRGAF